MMRHYNLYFSLKGATLSSTGSSSRFTLSVPHAFSHKEKHVLLIDSYLWEFESIWPAIPDITTNAVMYKPSHFLHFNCTHAQSKTLRGGKREAVQIQEVCDVRYTVRLT